MHARLTTILPLLLALSAGGCGDQPAASPKGGKKDRRFPVETERLEPRSLDYLVRAVGSVEAFERVRVTARVPGVVARLRFTEGDNVAAGAVLVEIDPERHRLAADSARARLEKATVVESDARRTLERREAILARVPGGVSAEELDTARGTLSAASAELADAKAASALAELDRKDAFVRAPVGGTIETRSVSTGQFLERGAELATIVRVDPLLLRFTLPEADAIHVTPGHAVEFTVRGSPTVLRARVKHVAAAADVASRMVMVIAVVEAGAASAPATAPAITSTAPRPGSFAEVSLRTGGSATALAVPETAVRPSARGFLVFTVEDGVAHEHTVHLGMRTEDGRVEVRDGLLPGAVVVVRGAEALRDGAAVDVAPPPKSATPSP